MQNAASMIVQSILNVNVLIRINYFVIGGSVGLNSYFYRTILEKLKKIQPSIKIKKAKLRSKAELFGCFVYINKKLFLKRWQVQIKFQEKLLTIMIHI